VVAVDRIEFRLSLEVMFRSNYKSGPKADIGKAIGCSSVCSEAPGWAFGILLSYSLSKRDQDGDYRSMFDTNTGIFLNEKQQIQSG